MGGQNPLIMYQGYQSKMVGLIGLGLLRREICTSVLGMKDKKALNLCTNFSDVIGVYRKNV